MGLDMSEAAFLQGRAPEPPGASERSPPETGTRQPRPGLSVDPTWAPNRELDLLFRSLYSMLVAAAPPRYRLARLRLAVLPHAHGEFCFYDCLCVFLFAFLYLYLYMCACACVRACICVHVCVRVHRPSEVALAASGAGRAEDVDDELDGLPAGERRHGSLVGEGGGSGDASGADPSGAAVSAPHATIAPSPTRSGGAPAAAAAARRPSESPSVVIRAHSIAAGRTTSSASSASASATAAPSRASTVRGGGGRALPSLPARALDLVRTLIAPTAAGGAHTPLPLVHFVLAFLSRLATFPGAWSGLLVAVRNSLIVHVCVYLCALRLCVYVCVCVCVCLLVLASVRACAACTDRDDCGWGWMA
jgi:hypothetical protein